jgi:YHS domain-containing protein
MTPLRLLILIVLCYIGWRMLRSGLGKKPPQAAQDSASSPEDVLVEDPVCHVLIPKHQALRLRRDGVTYYFCSEQCCDQFAGQPEKGEP